MRLLAGILLLLLAQVTQAGTEPVILSVYGDIQLDENHYQRLDFTLSELQALTQAEVTTSHPWNTKAQHYRGVDLNALFQQLFAQKHITSLNLEALNGFSVMLDWSKINEFSPILAWQEDGQLMSRRNKGPLWLVLPFDQMSKVKQAEFMHYMAWQLKVIRVYSEPE
ncbi:molybdopterin-binding protein [Oceanisphaera profunda]|uniref:Molybdopterin-binding protein n=1 Tax=Oceanisphaera profunda TaxID=1416627 RepID=A0A1Y0D789_9GAMM|nr:molybdopterin-binding protein [Oceanisphaera profunda]ART83067.1 molybdopterin-binding protein [Oceanisphaera profunda]